tara:strand:- start:59 stop:421 length:363 start_codon:yes stop_codon:yes gene_type:complete
MNRYGTIPQTTSPNGKLMYKTVRYPEIPRSFNDTYIYATEGDRFDTLADQFYGDSSLWWVISNANGNFQQNSLYPPLGVQLRIPSNLSLIISSYEEINDTQLTQTNPSQPSPSGGSGGGY